MLDAKLSHVRSGREFLFRRLRRLSAPLRPTDPTGRTMI